MTEGKLSAEHLALLEEADELGINTLGYRDPKARLDRLRETIARRTAELAKEAVNKRRLEQADEEEIEAAEATIRGAFDESMADTRGVLVRVVEWTEWIPVTPSPHLTALTLANGITGFEAGENERVLTVEGIGTNRSKTVDVDEGTLVYMLYAFKATLAQNVHTTLVATLVEAQGSNLEGEEQKPQPSRIITPEDGSNRQQRRHPRA